jgi:outer membrane biosynthesis protein TonB
MRIRTIAAGLVVMACLVSFSSAPAAVQVRASAEVMAERFTYRVTARYPDEARDTGIQGTVELDVVIDDEGGVSDLRVATGHPLLAMAAAGGGEQWLCLPYSVDG